jgi:hypothetical protein
METHETRSLKIKVISLCIFIKTAVASFLMYLNNLLSTLFSNILRLLVCSPFSVNDQVSHSYKITSRIMQFYDLTFII